MADTQGLDPEFAVKIQQMVDSSGGRLWINSGYRTVERQAQLYNAAVNQYGDKEARNHVAPPGKSNHNFGLAVDLGGDLNLAHQLAPRYGLTFPMSWEPWHIEPINARQKRGGEYKDAILPTPPGVTADPHEPLGSIHNQIANFTALLQGTSAESLDAQWNTAGPTTPAGEPGATGGTLTAGLDATGKPGEFNPVTWAHDFLSAGGFPTTPENMRAIQAWEQAEGGIANSNPLNTTQGGYAGASDINSVGVKKYATYDDSIKANLQALQNGRYGNIIAALQSGTDANAVADAISKSPWGTGELVKKILAS